MYLYAFCWLLSCESKMHLLGKHTRNDLIVYAVACDRFSAIFSNLHYADNPQSDKFSKACPHINKLSSEFWEYCHTRKP